MFTEGYSFPHPVLGNEDDMSGEFNVSFHVVRTDDRRIQFSDVSVEITNPYIMRQVEEGKAKCLVKVYCSSTLSTWVFAAAGSFDINEDELINKAEIQAFIITQSEISNYSNVTFNSQYGDEFFSVSKNEVIGISGKVTIQIPKVSEKLGLGNIFKFYAHETQKPIEFEYHHDKIHINYPVTENGDHPPNMLFSNSPWTAFNIFIVPALSEALRYAEEDPDDSSQWEWYSVVDQLLPSELRKGNNFADAQRILQKGLPVLLAYNELAGA